MSKQKPTTVSVTRIVSHPPDSNLETSVTHSMLLEMAKAVNENDNRNNQRGEAFLRFLAQYTHMPKSDNENVMNTLILYRTTSKDTLPGHQIKIASANTP